VVTIEFPPSLDRPKDHPDLFGGFGLSRAAFDDLNCLAALGFVLFRRSWSACHDEFSCWSDRKARFYLYVYIYVFINNYARNPLAREPDVETAFRTARKFLSKKITQHVDALAKELGDKGAAKALKQANQEYGYSKRIVQIAEDRLNRVGANNMFSLSDTMAGAGTAAAGGAAGAILGGDVESAVKGAALGLGGAAASKIARSYGAGVGARGLDIASKAASKSKALIKGAAPTMRLLMSPDYLSNPDLYRSDEMILSGDER
jgi:hypothetical protein